MEIQKKIKGSAILDQEGLFVFTPYHTGGTERNMHLVKSTSTAALWRGKKSYSIRIKIPMEKFPPLHKVVAALMELYTAAHNDQKEVL